MMVMEMVMVFDFLILFPDKNIDGDEHDVFDEDVFEVGNVMTW